MKTRNILTSTLMISSTLVIMGCSSSAVQSAVDALAKITATVPASTSGTQLQAICADGTIKTSPTVTTAQTVSLSVPQSTDCSLTLITDKDDTATRVITPIELTNGTTTGTSVNLTKDITLPELTPSTNAGTTTPVKQTITVSDTELSNDEIKTTLPLDNDDNGVSDIYEVKGNSSTVPAFTGEDKNNDGVSDSLDSDGNGKIDDIENHTTTSGTTGGTTTTGNGGTTSGTTGGTTTNGNGGTTSGTNNMPVKKFASDVVSIFDTCKGCHTTSNGRIFKVGTTLETYNSIIDNNLIDKITPSNSQLLQKNDGTLTHSGGATIAKGSVNYNTIKAWITAGALNN